MKKTYYLSYIILLVLILTSWGVVGHRTIGKIAENNLTPKAKAAVQQLLGNETLSGVSTWADEVRNQPEYKQTASWHYVNLPLGLDYDDFAVKVSGITQANVYSALLDVEHDLLNPSISKEKKIEALKFVVHLVGDLHQPMHVSRSEDKGGNTIQLNYNGKGTNLHSLWDSGMLNTQGMSFEQLATKFQPTASQIKKWQKDPQIKWVWESYQISTQLYSDVDAMKSRKIDDAYYKKYIPIADERMQQAGVRLAGILNEIFSKASINSDLIPPPDLGVLKDNPTTIKLCDKVYSGRYFSNSNNTLLNVGAEYPNQKVTLVIKGALREQFKQAPEVYFKGKNICVTGKQTMYKGKPQIEINEVSQIQVL